MSSIHSTPFEPFEPRARSLIDVHPQDDGTDDDNLASSIMSNGPKLNTKISSLSNFLLKNEENWAIRKIANGEEELYSKGKCVYYTRNSLIIKTFNFTEQVVKVFWTKFSNSDHICVALSNGVSIFDKTGQHYQITIPFPYENIYPSPHGLIVERNCDSSDDSLPVIFAITHPTYDIAPVLFKTTGYPRLLRFSMPSSNSIVGCHEDLPICLIQNSDNLNHSIWRMRRSTTDELKVIERFFDEANDTKNEANNTQSNYQFNSLRENPSQLSMNVSTKQRSSLMHQSNPSPATTFSPKMDLRSRPSALGSLAASRLGVGYATINTESNCANVRSYNSAHSLNMMYTPSKNRRIVNYLRDNIEDPILPELVFEQIWVEPPNGLTSTRASKFFIISDMVGIDYMVIVSSNCVQLNVVKDESPAGEPFRNVIYGRSYNVAAIDAMPLQSMKLMLVLDCNKNVLLHSGPDRLISVNLTQVPNFNPKTLPASSPMATRASAEMTPIQMSSARKRSSIGDRTSLGSDPSIQQMYRALSPVPHASQNEAKLSQLVHLNDIRRFEFVIGQTVYIVNSQNRRAKFDIPSLCQTRCVMSLLEAMKSLVSKELGLNMIANWYQTRRSALQPELMHASDELKLFKNWFLNSIGLGNNYFDTNEKSRPNELKLLHASPSKKSRKNRDVETNQMVSNLHTLFYAMHLVFEDLLFNKLSYGTANDLAELLLVVSCLLRLNEYQNYYWIMFPGLQDKFGPQKTSLENMLSKPEALYRAPFFRFTPPSAMMFISKIIDRSHNSDYYHEDNESLAPFHTIKNVTEGISTVISLFCVMFNLPIEDALINITEYDQASKNNGLPLIKNDTKFTRSKKADERLVELMVKLKKDRNYLSCLPEGVNLYLWDAILNCRESPPTYWDDQCFRLIGRMDLVSLVRGQTNVHLPAINSSLGDTQDETLKLLFPDDIRVSEAQRMLASDVPVEFNVMQRQGSTEEESRDETHRHLYLLNIRTMALPVGRGAICLRTYSPVIGESFDVPKLELTGRVISEDRPMEYTHDPSVYPWPFFHNGVAAGLTICSSTANNIIDSTWINYNRPRSNIAHGADMRDRDLATANINNEHAGFLFALGLNGHLEKLSLMALHDYLCQNNDLTKLAILLGMAAAKRGSRDNNIIKVLSIHVDALLPPNSTELDVPAPVHAAAIMGVGLLYESSGDSHISKVLLEEIGRLPGPEANSHVDRESYSLSAGLAFGLVNLCKGKSSTISSSDQLRLYMLGGKRRPLTSIQKDRYLKQDCHCGEEDYINTHVTSPGGTLALGLMYHRSCNQSVASWMRAPDTQTLLEYVRPDFLTLRMLSYGLIMWDQIEPSENWINAQIPEIVSANAFQRNSTPGSSGSFESVINADVKIDYELISQAYCNIVAGCCLAIAMRYAGTADKNAYKTIYKQTKMLIALSNKALLAEQAGRPCIEACLNVLVTSLAVVMAGTGHLGVMRVCRYLRSRLTQNCVFYGSYIAIHMALGILFLGACRYSLSSSPGCVAALVCSLYPIYPNHSADNRYHLQALRHLYVLAAEPRLLIPLDIQTNKPVYVNVTVRQRKLSHHEKQADKSGTVSSLCELTLRAPCLMPELETIESVCVHDEGYWRIEINSREALMRCLFKDQGCLSVKQKAHSSNNQLVQDIETYILQNMPKGVNKNRKSSALSECVREDRVEQYSALNELLTRASCGRRATYRSLTLAQIRLASSLAHEEPPTSDSQFADSKEKCLSAINLVNRGENNECRRMFINKMHLLRPLIGELSDWFEEKKVHDQWCDYICQTSDWTVADESVAYYIVLNELNHCPIEGRLAQTLRDLSLAS